MFTPPPSPRPKARDDSPITPVLESGTKNFPPVVDPKRRIARRTWWAVILVPLVLILITAFTRYLMHPAAFDIFVSAPESLSWHEMSSGHLWQSHKRHQGHERRQLAVVSSSASIAPTTSASPTTAAIAPVPTIPSSAPPLPTPFPQPYDTDLTHNFSSITCFNFFTNMTASLPFRSCRPLSFLMDSSSDFINAQSNLTLMNTIVWGTCNTTITEDQCTSNMGWFANALQTACSADLQNQNAVAVGALQDLRSYSLVRTSGCLTDPTANTYCYLDAVRSSSPSDLYFYGLPLGISLPNTTTPSCSACTRSLMSTYSAALADPAQAAVLTGLTKTYTAAAKLAIAQCGSGYATTSVASGAPALLLYVRSWWTGVALLLLGVAFQIIP